jgi:hypothetical protein
MANPNWADLKILKGVMYLALKDTDTDRDFALSTLGEMVTRQMIDYLDNPIIVPAEPSLALQRACLKQCTYEWKQRATPGLQSVQMQDGSINKYQTEEWLADVEKVLDRYKRFPLYETTA